MTTEVIIIVSGIYLQDLQKAFRFDIPILDLFDLDYLKKYCNNFNGNFEFFSEVGIKYSAYIPIYAK